MRVPAVQADQRVPARRGVCPQYGRQYRRVPRGADPAVERALGVCSGVCRTDLVRRHRGSASCEKPVRHGKADPDDTGVLSRRGGILPAVRSHRADGVCTDGAEYQHRDRPVWCTGRHLYYGASEVLQRVSLRPHAEGVGANPWLGDQKDRHQGFYPLGIPVSYC